MNRKEELVWKRISFLPFVASWCEVSVNYPEWAFQCQVIKESLYLDIDSLSSSTNKYSSLLHDKPMQCSREIMINKAQVSSILDQIKDALI
jgi:hypothetical protein